MKERCPTKLLADTPAETDAFGSHERVAGSIAEVVQTESGGKAIGLEGGWGAGKSTIVKLISQKLSHTRESAHEIAVFDMWSHQDDPLRRTFLESLITRVQGFGWVNKEKWDQRIAELARRRREDTTRIVPRLTRTGVGFAFTLLAIPIGSALIGAGLSLLGSKDASATLGAVLLPVGIIIALAPAIYYGGVRIWRIIRRGWRSEEDGGLSELPALVTGQASTESRTLVTQTPDPTSVEFESIFRDLLDEALEPENRKLLIVVDNLDRVEPSDALSIWSTLQTFLGHTDYQRPDWIDRLWVLIPYDHNAILRLWDGSGSNATKPANSSLATSFLDKTFQLRFRVPPLLLSNWREFLQQALQQALPNHQEADFHGVYRAFAANGGLEASAPTPRGLKTFVNQIGALHREWQDEFPLSHLACYVLFQGDGKDVRKALLSNDDSELLSRSIGQEWRGVIAALHFSVPVEETRQLLLRGPIQAALVGGDGKALSNLESVHRAGFWAVLEDTVPAGANDWSSVTPADLAKAATALADSGLFDHSDGQPEPAALRSTIQTAATAVQAWTPFDAGTAHGMVRVGHLVGNREEMFPVLLAGASNARVWTSEKERQEGDVSPSVWMSSAFTLIEGLVQLGSGEHMEQAIRVPLGAEQWLEVSHEVVEKDPHGQLLKYFSLQAVAEIDELLAQQVGPGQVDENIYDAVQTAMATGSGNTMNNVASEVFSHLQSGEAIQGDQLAFMLRILRSSIAAGLIAEDQYAEFASSGYYLHHLHQAFSDNHSEAVGECVFGYLQAVPDASEPDEFGSSNAGYENLTELLQNPDTVPRAVEHFIARAKETQQLRVVLQMATGKRPVPPFLVEVLGTLLISDDVSKPPELVKAKWSLIRSILQKRKEDSQSFEIFLKGLPGLDNLITGVINGTFSVGESGLYFALLKGGTDAGLVTWCARSLSGINRDAWTKEIKPRGDLVELVIELKNRGASLTLGSAYLDALVTYSKSVAADSRRVLPNESWDTLFALLDTEQRELFRSRIYGVLEQSDGEASIKFFDLFGSMLSNSDLLANERGFIDRICRSLLDADNEGGLAWVADTAESNPTLLTGSKEQAAANDFRDRVRQRLNDTPADDAIVPHLKRIGTVLDIERGTSGAELETQAEDDGATSE